MMNRLQAHVLPRAHRRGVTLTEVLMSMLIMSVGVSFVAAVFPLSVLKSIQGAQMTAATILRFQAEALIDMFPDLVHNPDGVPLEGLDGTLGNADDRINTYTEHFGTKYLVDPWAYHIHAQDGTVFGGANTPLCGSNPAVVPFRGYFGIDRTGAPSILRYDGGIFAQTASRPNTAPWNEYRERLAATLSASADRWNTFVNSDAITPVLNGNGEVIGLTFGPNVDLVGLDDPATNANAGIVPDAETGRITIFHGNGRQSQSYPITRISGQEVRWTESGIADLNGDGTVEVRPLPQHFADGAGGWDLSHAVIEISQMRLFTWIMSVRKKPHGAGVDIAVIFNRQVDALLEYAYMATFVPETNIVAIDLDPGASEPEPFIKKGGYVFDAQNCRWYRIQDFQERPTVGTWPYSDYDYVVFTETPIIEPGGEDTYVDINNVPTLNLMHDDETSGGTDTNGNGVLDDEDRNGDNVHAPSPAAMGRAVFLPGVIEVYPLGTKAVAEDL